MTTNMEAVNTSEQIYRERSDAADLFSQQIWCWGRDILRKEGNWLIEQGFDVVCAPEEKVRSKKIYSLSLPNFKNLILRGFGALFSDPNYGTIFLPRYDFRPKYTKSTELDKPPWDIGDLPEFQLPVESEIKFCRLMLIDLIDWIIGYENNVINKLGIKYRDGTITDWDNGKKRIIPAKEIIPRWVEIRNEIQEVISFS